MMIARKVKTVPEMLTPKEVAQIMTVSYDTALAFIKYSGIDYIKVGRQYRVSRQKLEVFLNKKGITLVSLDE